MSGSDKPQHKERLLKEEDIVDVLNNFLFSRFENIHTGIPAQVEGYEEGTRKAKVKLLVKLVRKNGDILEVPIIENVPVMFPASAAFTLTFPLAKGDKGLVMFAETGIGNYLNGSGQEVEADSPARFQLTDAMFLPGLYPFSTVAQGSAFIKSDGSGVISINGDSDYAVRFTKLETEFNKLRDAWDIFATAYVPGSPSVTGLPPSASASGADLSGAKIESIKVPS